jgi:hypothetical protein
MANLIADPALRSIIAGVKGGFEERIAKSYSIIRNDEPEGGRWYEMSSGLDNNVSSSQEYI